MIHITVVDASLDIPLSQPVDLVLENPDQYLPGYDRIARAIHDGGELHVLVRDRTVSRWLALMARRYGPQHVTLEELTLRRQVQKQIGIEIPANVTDAQILASGLLELNIPASPGMPFEDYLLEVFFGNFLTLPGGLRRVGELIASYEPDQWQSALERPLVSGVYRERARETRRQLQQENRTAELQLLDWVEASPDVLIRNLFALKILASYPAELGERVLGKVRYARKTVYVIPREWIPGVFSATREMLEKRLGPYLEHLGLTQNGFTEISESIMKAVAGDKMTTKEIKKKLSSDLNISAIVNLMCDRGMLIRGCPAKGWRSNLHTYHLFQEYFPGMDLNAVDEEDAKKSMIKKYLASFGPVTVTDASWWSGFTKTEVKQALEDFKEEILNLKISGLEGNYILLASDSELLDLTKIPDKPSVNFLPLLDPYLMGYKDRERYLAQEHYANVFDRSGNVTSTILCDGTIIGVWDFSEEKIPAVKIFLFEEVRTNVSKEIRSHAGKIGKFISGSEVQIKECRSLVPLTKRPMGGFMSPLKRC